MHNTLLYIAIYSNNSLVNVEQKIPSSRERKREREKERELESSNLEQNLNFLI